MGTNGANGTNGKSIGSVVNYYLATASSSGVTTATSGWTTAVQSVSAAKKYLWNYEVVKYTDGTVASTTVPCIIGHTVIGEVKGIKVIPDQPEMALKALLSTTQSPHPIRLFLPHGRLRFRQ